MRRLRAEYGPSSASRREFVGRRAVCVWEAPRWARGKVVRGAIGIRVAAEGSSLRRRKFSRLLT